ncbi:hypothetical protein BC941DRAFT_518578 [Chlamydoabsidia padenii]|nr:hypothetical protein BC941DRAFT_518578 [Chlamydoabsidia padenii]
MSSLYAMVESITCLQDIPVELVERIIDCLPPRSCAVLLRTCRFLSQPSFRRILYQSVLLQDKQQLDGFLTSIRATHSLGQHVRHITISTRLARYRHTMTELQQWCPNITNVQLTLEPGDSRLRHQCDLTRWSHLVSASDDLYSNINEIIQSMHQQLVSLSITRLPVTNKLPYLTSLDYHGDILDMDTLDQINQICPTLQTLTIKALDVFWNGKQLKTTGWTVGRSLVRLELKHVYLADPAWYGLFSQLYPQLHTLILHIMAASSKIAVARTRQIYSELDSSDDDDDGNDDEQHGQQQQHQLIDYRHYYTWETTTRAMTELMVGLTRLRRLHIYTIGVTPTTNDTNNNEDWLGLLYQLEEVRLDWYCKPFKTYGGMITEKTSEPKWERVQSLINHVTQAQTWYLFLKQDPIPLQQQTLELLATTRQLTSLTLYTTYESDTTLPIDILLTLLPQLTTLEFWTKFGKDLSSPIEKQAPRLKPLTPLPPHGLTRFVYIGKLTSSRLVAYVHARCPRLKVLHLDARQTPTKKHVRLVLPGCRLTELDLGSSQTFGKMQKSVLVQETDRSSWFVFSNGGWERSRQALGSTNLTITCDSIDRCVFKPLLQYPFF